MRPTGCPETSVRNYHYSLRNNPEERSSHLLRGESLKSRTLLTVRANCSQGCNIYIYNTLFWCFQNFILICRTGSLLAVKSEQK